MDLWLGKSLGRAEEKLVGGYNTVRFRKSINKKMIGIRYVIFELTLSKITQNQLQSVSTLYHF